MTNQTQDIPSFLLAPQQELAFARGGSAVSQAAVILPARLTAEEVRVRLGRLVERHEILRTTFLRLPGLRTPRQSVRESFAPAFATIEGAPLETVFRNEAAAVDVEHGPVLRAALVGRELVLTAPAVCLDAQSMTLLVRELLGSGDTDEVEPLQYADYAEWRRRLADDDPAGAEAAAGWWAHEPAPFAGPLFIGRPSLGTPVPERTGFAIGDDVVRAVQRAAEASRATAAVFLEACLHALVLRVTGAAEVTLAGLADGRAQPDLADAVGPYSQLVPIRTRSDEQTTFAELVDQVARARADAARWQDFASAGDLARVARAVISFTYLGAEVERLERLESAPQTALDLAMHEGRDGRLRLELTYDSAAYELDAARRVAASMAAVVASAAADPGRRVAELALLDDAGRAEMVALADGGARESPDPLFRRAFEQRAAAGPDVLAVTDGRTPLTYGELNEAANRLAHHLAAVGVTPGAAVALCLDRSTDAIIAILAILKAGAAFVPVNIDHPSSRVDHQLREAKTQAVVTRSELRARLPATEAAVVSLDTEAEAIASRPDTDPPAQAGPEGVAYVMYTSGSTGLPKGVAVTNGNVAHYTARMLERIGDVTGLHFAVVSALSTDLGYTSLFPPLAGGGAVHLVPPDVVLDPDAYAAFAQENRIDVLKITPSLLSALLAGRGAEVLPRRWLVCGGEAFTLDLLARIREAGATCRTLNHYGPTETTIGTCAFDVDGEIDGAAATVPIGRPFANSRAYVVDPAGQPTPVGVTGELLVGGDGVARGYVNRAEETAERFVDDRLWGAGRVYRTGDRARFLPDGGIEFLGRIDEQVKIRGYRVEPSEVEAALFRNPAVRQAAVIVQQSDGEPRLVAYVAASPATGAEELRRQVAEWVPEYMLPSFVQVDLLPLTPSGKIDRHALSQLRLADERGANGYVAPRNDLERELAELWQELLGVERVGVTDDFFELGGHSLLATQMITRIRSRHGNVPLRALFTAPTVSALAEVLSAPAGPDHPEVS